MMPSTLTHQAHAKQLLAAAAWCVLSVEGFRSLKGIVDSGYSTPSFPQTRANQEGDPGG